MRAQDKPDCNVYYESAPPLSRNRDFARRQSWSVGPIHRPDGQFAINNNNVHSGYTPSTTSNEFPLTTESITDPTPAPLGAETCELPGYEGVFLRVTPYHPVFILDCATADGTRIPLPQYLELWDVAGKTAELMAKPTHLQQGAGVQISWYIVVNTRAYAIRDSRNGTIVKRVRWARPRLIFE